MHLNNFPVRRVIYSDPRGRRLEGPATVAVESADRGWQGCPFNIHRLSGHGVETAMGAGLPTVVTCFRGEGAAIVDIGGARTTLKFQAGLVCIAGQGYCLENVEWAGDDAELLELQFPPDMLSRFAPEVAMPMGRVAMRRDDETICAILSAMRSELVRGCPSGALFSQSLCGSLARCLYGICCVGQRADHSVGTAGLSGGQRARIDEFIAAHMSHDIGVKDLALILRLSESQFTRRFRASTGVSPYQYLQRRRIDQALLLLKSCASLGEIAQRVGLSSQSHFSHTFKQLVGLTPARARAELQGMAGTAVARSDSCAPI